MFTAKDYTRIIGVVLSTCGLSCVPVGRGFNPRRDLSVFNNFVDTGASFSLGVVLLSVGLTMVLLSLLIPFVADRCQTHQAIASRRGSKIRNRNI